MTRCILAHDLGTTGNKATLYDETGELRGSSFYAYPTQYERTGWAEQDPNDWWQAVCTTTRTLLTETGINGANIACITFSGQMQGVVALDSSALPLRSAIIWADQRATAQADRIGEKISRDDIYRITGHRLSPAYSLHKILWMRDNQPDIFANTHKFMCAKDAIAARLTGEFCTEPSDASGMNLYDLRTGEWSAAIMEAAELDMSKLPQLVRSIDVIGGITVEAAKEIGLPAGIPVVLGGGDGACASVGAGSVSVGQTYSYVGSSAWIATASREPVNDAQQRTFTFGHVVPDLFIPMGTMQSAGSAYQWLRDQLAPIERNAAEAGGVSAYDLLNAVAETSPPGANNLLFLPYLLGERAPRWNPDARAVFLGLTMRHQRADMIRAVLEGVAFNLRAILIALTAPGLQINDLRVIGGGVSGRLWRQIMADIYGVPLQRLAILEEATSMGAAVVGGVGVGVYDDFSIAERMNPVVGTVQPDEQNRRVYDDLYAIFEHAYTAIEPIYDELARIEQMMRQ